MAGAEGGLAAPASQGGRPVVVRSFDEWRNAVRMLLAQGIAPHEVNWQGGAQEADLFAADELSQAEMSTETPPSAARVPTMRVSRQLMELLESAACFRAPDRWAFLYHVMWRWQHGEKDVVSAADQDGARLYSMAKAVRREEHDMHAYIRFRERPEEAGPPRFVAWFEPNHDVLPQVAAHFSRRMGQVTWMIATPDAAVLWDGAALHEAPPLMRSAADIDDAGEALWLTYYRSIFNPARLNAGIMHSHIPSRFWKNLPEGAVVPEMVSQAATGARRTGQTTTVGQRGGTVIHVAGEKAQPQREAPSTLDQCRRCDLWRQATQAVGGAGPAEARIMLVGEQPGDQEDLAGKAFVGPAGGVLDRALEQAALDRKSVYLTNAVKHFKWEPRGKRRLHKTPAQQEVVACHVWLEQELEQVRPQVVVALGATALKAVTGDSHASLTPLLGKPFRHDGYWVVAVYHPSYVLRVTDEADRQHSLDVIVDGLLRAKQLAEEGAPG
jgi:DNA polymerase